MILFLQSRNISNGRLCNKYIARNILTKIRDWKMEKNKEAGAPRREIVTVIIMIYT